MNYKEFLANKRFVLESSGFDIDKAELNPMLYEFQKDVVRWALKKGKACIFADCGLGKTPMQLSWAYQVHKHTGGKSTDSCTIGSSRADTARSREVWI